VVPKELSVDICGLSGAFRCEVPYFFEVDLAATAGLTARSAAAISSHIVTAVART
jgi:hypothetical protein